MVGGGRTIERDMPVGNGRGDRVMRIDAARWLTALVVALNASLAIGQVAPAPVAPVSSPATAPAIPSVLPVPTDPLLTRVADPTPPTLGSFPSLPLEVTPPTTNRQYNLQPSEHLLTHTGSGILGPYQYDTSDRWLDFGIIVQAEYMNNNPNNGPSSEYLFFRRLRPVIMGGFGDWQAVLMMDYGAGQNGDNYQSSVRWADIEYTGIFQSHVRFGSFKPWFSSELLTLGPHLLNIERSPVGNTNYGNPDYMLGVAWDQMLPSRKLAYYVSAGLEDHTQDVTQMSMRSPAYAPNGSNQGAIVTGRVDYMLLGEMEYDPRPLHTPTPSAYNRSDFHTPYWRMLVSSAVYGWWNDGTSNPYTKNGASTSTTQADLQRSLGVEVSTGLRGFGFTTNVEYQYIRGDLVVNNFTGGLYANGSTNMNKFLVSTGYMLPHDIEPVVAWSMIDASGFQRSLMQTTVGVNWFVKKYAIRFAADYSFVNNNNGVPGTNLGVTRAMAQFVW